MDASSAQTRQIVEAVRDTVSGLTSDVKAIRDYRYTDLLLHIGAFAAGIILVVTLILNVYSRLDDKIQTLSTLTTRADTKLEDLLQRIPPVQAPAPHR
ncbi:MAG TPA: hypothetical protein VGH13_13525 [Xanthobacteraceae bacterium]|jgi:hypothetical protein